MEDPVTGMKLAGFWQRFGGLFLDLFLLFGTMIASDLGTPFAVWLVELLFAYPWAFADAWNRLSGGPGLPNGGFVEGLSRYGPGPMIPIPPWWPEVEPKVLGASAIAVPALVFAAYWIWFIHIGETLGMSAAGVRVVRAGDGKPPTWLQSAVRLVAMALSAAPCFLGFLWMAVDRRKQAWHDKIAGTIVVQRSR